MRKSIILTIIVCLVVSLQGLFAAGSNSAAFLKIGMGAKNIAMGETGAAERGINSVFWNPAGLDTVANREVSFMHALWLSDISFENVSYAQKTGMGTFGVSVYYLSMSAIDKYDTGGVKLNDTFKPSDTAVAFSFARELKGIPLGVTLKYITSQIDNVSANAFAFDAGVLFDTLLPKVEGLHAGLAVQNIGTSMKYDKESFSLPQNLKLGANYTFAKNVTVALDLNKSTGPDIVLNTGAQYTYAFSKEISLAGRAGYKTNNKALGGSAGFTAGIGFEYASLGFDYAFVPYGDLDNTHRISLNYRF